MEIFDEYKQVVVGKSVLPYEFLEGLHGTVVYGVHVYTDSEEMNKYCRLLENHIQENASPDSSDDLGVNFFYFTKRQLPFVNSAGQSLKQLQVNYPGDIYMSPDMSSFYFYGIDKFGTLISMIYGIQALYWIERGMLGVHSALIYDQLCNQSYLLVGRSRIGKSSIGQLLEDKDPRFIMLSDDWNCVDLGRNIVKPSSVIFSPRDPTLMYTLAFKSFGKSFYWKRNIDRFRGVPLGKIIELYDENTAFNSDEFWKVCMSHVPFVPHTISMDIFDNPYAYTESDLDRFFNVQNQFRVAYKKLTDTYETVQVVNRKGTVPIDVAFQEILNCID